MARLTGRAALATVCAATVWVAAACTSTPQAAQPLKPAVPQLPQVRDLSAPFAGAPMLAPPDLRDTGPGSLVSVEPMTGSSEMEEADATYMRVEYRSTSGIDNSPTVVSGVVAIPPGTPPPGGWPVLSFGHGTTGVENKCAPGDFGTLPGNGPIISALLRSGFLVAMSDFQGLGVKGFYNPFTNSNTYGMNMIDAARAARRVGAAASTNWVAFGHSLGGMAAWAAADRAGTYGQGMNLKGTLSMAPAADMSGLADKAWAGTLTSDQRVALMFTLQSLSWSHPELDLNRYRRGYAAEHWGELLDCLPADLGSILKTRAKLTNADLRPETYADAIRLRDILESEALPQGRITGPMLVVYGTEDELVERAWFERAINRACALGDRLEIRESVGQGHGDLDTAFGIPWLIDRINGVPDTVDDCPNVSPER